MGDWQDITENLINRALERYGHDTENDEVTGTQAQYVLFELEKAGYIVMKDYHDTFRAINEQLTWNKEAIERLARRL